MILGAATHGVVVPCLLRYCKTWRLHNLHQNASYTTLIGERIPPKSSRASTLGSFVPQDTSKNIGSRRDTVQSLNMYPWYILKALTALLLFAKITQAGKEQLGGGGGFADLSPNSEPNLSELDKQLSGFGLDLSFKGIRTLRPQNCPCRCMLPELAKKQCSRFGAFCVLSGCTRRRGQVGQRCCRKTVRGFGRCECRGNRITLGISFKSQLAARNAASNFCAERRDCPPNCDCSACPVVNVFCLALKNVWACRADCRAQVTSCRRVLGK